MLHSRIEPSAVGRPSREARPASLTWVSAEWVAVGTFLLLVAAVGGAILTKTGGMLVYSLDDAYIHVALAERIRLGHYGLNMGEITSPSSSVIWPFLLVPFAGTYWGAAAPLLLNAAFGATAAYLLGRIATLIHLPPDWTDVGSHSFRIALACAMVVACNLCNLTFIGLEHSLQVVIAVALALALIQHAEGAPLPTWALTLAALGPSVRYELLALTAAVCFVLVLERRWRTVAIIAAGSLVLPAALGTYLTANGGYPLPNSVISKLTSGTAGGSESGSAVWDVLSRKMTQLGDLDALARIVLLGTLITMAWIARSASPQWRKILLAALGVGLLHFAVGQFGWWYRYELYAVAFCGTITIAVLSPRQPYAAMLGAFLAAYHYLPSVSHTPLAAANLYEQHYQMHRFVAEHYRKPFAVNDVGFVSVGLANGPYVLDLWGLASNEAVRQRDKSPEWMDEITRHRGAGLAMVYTSAFRGIPKSWTLVGELKLASPRVTAANEIVTFYATAAGDAADIKRHLLDWKPSLPAGVALDIK